MSNQVTTQLLEEQVDVIDINNQVVITVAKSRAHQDGLLHRIVIAELRNNRGEYCFVKQAADRQDPGTYVSPVGGHVSAGETIEAALIRECQEEVGFTPTIYHFVGSTIFNREVIGRKENHLFLVYEIDCDQEPVLNHESVGYKWFSVEEIKNTLHTNPEIFGGAWHHVYKHIFPAIYNS